jgi:hypothetical protein
LEAATAEAEAVEPPAEIIAELQKILGGGVNRQALEVQCPHCNAEPHNRCTLSDGSVLTKSVAHPARMKKAGVGDAPVAIRKSNSAPNA